jgi:hypothetical protein
LAQLVDDALSVGSASVRNIGEVGGFGNAESLEVSSSIFILSNEYWKDVPGEVLESHEWVERERLSYEVDI